MSNQLETLDTLCEQIFMLPSHEIKKDRFVNEDEDCSAPCNGKCISGACRT